MPKTKTKDKFKFVAVYRAHNNGETYISWHNEDEIEMIETWFSAPPMIFNHVVREQDCHGTVDIFDFDYHIYPIDHALLRHYIKTQRLHVWGGVAAHISPN